MKVCLINPKVLTMSYPPLGALYIAAVLEKEGHKVKIFDPHPKDNTFIDEIVKFDPDFTGISIKTPEIKRAENIISQIKERLPSTFLVCGGIHATVCPEDLIKNKNIDCVAIGEGEYTAKEICERLEAGKGVENVGGVYYRNENNQIVRNERRGVIQNLDELPLPARHLIFFEDYLNPPGIIRGVWTERSTTVMASRGCFGRCIYCSTNLMFGKVVRYRSVDNVIQEIQFLIDKYKIDGIWFADDTFTANRDWVIKFSKKLVENDINLKWACESRVNTVSEEMFREMKRAGCVQLEFGIESGSEKVLKALKKDTTPDMIKNAFALAKKVNLRTLAFFIVGCPEETEEDVEKTLKLVNEIKPDFSMFFIATPYPGTELFNMAIQNGWIKDIDYSKMFTRIPNMEINFTKEELAKIRARLENAVFLRNFLPYIKDPKNSFKFLKYILGHPVILTRSFLKFLKTKNFDEMTFDFFQKTQKTAKLRRNPVY